MALVYSSLVISAQSALHVAIVEITEGMSMRTAKGRLQLFVLSAIDVILTLQMNAISSGYLPPI